MKSDDWRRAASPFCGRLNDDDGIDPRKFFDSRSDRRDHRKVRQLCRQVARTLDFVLSGEIDDDLLRDLFVTSVDPAPNGSRLLVVLSPLPGQAERVDPARALARLGELNGLLRAEIARSIHRRKVPELIFQVTVDDTQREVGE